MLIKITKIKCLIHFLKIIANIFISADNTQSINVSEKCIKDFTVALHHCNKEVYPNYDLPLEDRIYNCKPIGDLICCAKVLTKNNCTFNEAKQLSQMPELCQSLNFTCDGRGRRRVEIKGI